MVKVHEIHQQVYVHMLGASEPVVRVKSGDTIVAETRDAKGLDKDGNPMPEAVIGRRPDTDIISNNPLVGPVFVEEARRGDVLAVHIEEIALNRDSAWSANLALTGEAPGHRWLNKPTEDRYDFDWRLDLERGVAILDMPNSTVAQAEVPIHPFIGAIGIAPRYGRTEIAATPGEYGGNMDCSATCAGTTLLFPVWVDGAYLSFGDVHAAQGDGEMCGAGLETSARVRLRLEVHSGAAQGWDWPRAETPDEILTIASADSLFQCVAMARREMVNWLATAFGYERGDGTQLLAQVGRIQVCNVVNPHFTVAVAFPKRYLPFA